MYTIDNYCFYRNQFLNKTTKEINTAIAILHTENKNLKIDRCSEFFCEISDIVHEIPTPKFMSA